jgi:hypothetical protein
VLILKGVRGFDARLYLTASDMGLGECAILVTNINLFAKMTGHVEGLVAKLRLVAARKSRASDRRAAVAGQGLPK